MVFDVNGAIGMNICMDAADILVVSGKAATFYQGNKVNETPMTESWKKMGKNLKVRNVTWDKEMYFL